MSKIITYLTFSGNCREAMAFYQACLGGTLHFQTIEESPLAEGLPQSMKDCILHSTLKHNQLILLGTDLVDDKGLKRGNTVSMMIDCSSEEEMRTYYSKLSQNGHQTSPIVENYWGALFGTLTDQFGNQWLLQYKR